MSTQRKFYNSKLAGDKRKKTSAYIYLDPTLLGLSLQMKVWNWHNCYFYKSVELKLGIMKTLIFLLAGAAFTSFVNKPVENDLDGYWMGYYRSRMLKEKVIIKLDSDDKLFFYTGGIDDRTKLEGTYKIYGDSVSFSYKTADGEEVLMQGHFNYRKTYVDGICRTNNIPTGSFYLEKQKLQERIVSNIQRQNKMTVKFTR